MLEKRLSLMMVTVDTTSITSYEEIFRDIAIMLGVPNIICQRIRTLHHEMYGIDRGEEEEWQQLLPKLTVDADRR